MARQKQQDGFYGEKANVEGPENEHIKRFYTPQPVSVTKADYDEWASNYEQNTVQDSGYCAPEILTELICQLVDDKSARIIDLGCGTGLLGKILSSRGFTNIEGWDLSPKMLEQADKTGAYRCLNEIDLTVDLPFAANSCPIMVSVGVYGPGIVGPEHVKLLLPPLAVGGLSIHSFNGLSWRQRPFAKAIDDLAVGKHISIIEKNWAPYIRHENIDGVYLAFTKNKET